MFGCGFYDRGVTLRRLSAHGGDPLTAVGKLMDFENFEEVIASALTRHIREGTAAIGTIPNYPMVAAKVLVAQSLLDLTDAEMSARLRICAVTRSFCFGLLIIRMPSASMIAGWRDCFVRAGLALRLHDWVDMAIETNGTNEIHQKWLAGRPPRKSKSQRSAAA